MAHLIHIITTPDLNLALPRFTAIRRAIKRTLRSFLTTRDLSQLSAHYLRDIGLTPQDTANFFVTSPRHTAADIAHTIRLQSTNW